MALQECGVLLRVRFPLPDQSVLKRKLLLSLTILVVVADTRLDVLQADD